MINREYQRLAAQVGWSIVSEVVKMGKFKLAYRTKITTLIQVDSHNQQRKITYVDASKRCDQSITIAYHVEPPSLTVAFNPFQRVA